MSDSFIPLVPVAAVSHETTLTSMKAKGLAPAAPVSETEKCAKPVVTLQRNGEVVSGIRIQCGCGQVVDLSCIY
jgi:hypothetical protein